MSDEQHKDVGMTITAEIDVNIRDLPRIQLFIHELETLRDDMRVGASPFAERLEHAIDRLFADVTDDEPEADAG